ncbi:unnamed protein product [Dicrocoelium dendriticum]|nr:unnamed protein product [Dicrocoelium dendriticum]
MRDVVARSFDILLTVQVTAKPFIGFGQGVLSNLHNFTPVGVSEETKRRCIERWSNIKGYKNFRSAITNAAVLIPLCLVHNIPSILFLRRPLHLRSHPGEIGFPGGICDPSDEGDVVRTALREAHEEVGLPPESVDVWTTLPSLDAGVSWRVRQLHRFLCCARNVEV